MCGSSHSRTHRKSYSHKLKNSALRYSPLPASSTSQNDQRVICTQCQNINPPESKFCSRCGSQIEVCAISKLPFHPDSNYAKCISCQSYFHVHHLLEWQKTNDHCPVCRNRLQVTLGSFSKTTDIDVMSLKGKP